MGLGVKVMRMYPREIGAGRLPTQRSACLDALKHKCVLERVCPSVSGCECLCACARVRVQVPVHGATKLLLLHW